jgi:hypothetical protein
MSRGIPDAAAYGEALTRLPELDLGALRQQWRALYKAIAFGNAGRLWAVSEAGSRHIYDHPFLDLFQPFFPLVFALDPSRLE